MNTIIQQQIEVLNDTIQYYSEDTTRRAFQYGICSYHNSKGNKCAVGRLLTDEELEEVIDSAHHNSVVEVLAECGLLPKRLLDLGINFLQRLQQLHDASTNWNGFGLSNIGKERHSHFLYEIEQGNYLP